MATFTNAGGQRASSIESLAEGLAMAIDRNFITLFRDWTHLMAEFGSTTSVHMKIKSIVRAAEKQHPLKSPYYRAVNACGFILQRESILIHRGRSRDAGGDSPISSVGYVAMVPSLADKFLSSAPQYGGRDLNTLWVLTGGWEKNHMAVIEMFYTDSKLSAIIARRAIDQNHFRDATLSREAEARMRNKSPGNPEFITGPSDEYISSPITKKYVSEDITGPKVVNFL